MTKKKNISLPPIQNPDYTVTVTNKAELIIDLITDRCQNYINHNNMYNWAVTAACVFFFIFILYLYKHGASTI